MVALLRVAACVLLLPFALSTPTPTPAESESDLVLTPSGYQNRANVHHVPSGAHIMHVADKIHVLHPNGTLFKVVTPKIKAPTPVVARSAASAAATMASGWITYASWVSSAPDTQPIKNFTTSFTSPQEPASNIGQTLFLFNGLCPADGTSIIQPVLQYGYSSRGGGSYWSSGAWYAFSNTEFFASPLEPTPDNWALNATIGLTNFTAGTGYTYAINMQGAPGAKLTVTSPQNLVWATIALESYGVTSIKNYPAGSTSFNQVSLLLSNGTVPAPTQSWAVFNNNTDGITTTVVANKFNGGVVKINY
ncbi:hypothetical protein MIND_01173300 [Mycena indigotica]|uniref:Uncharacterized protein n=1 Tax=Mycena indigotica TaxID=2126181 RepID=A0A8H6S5K3_9AGAR|nr:uncharacterized protein MIND_01173300 [Mycena indigotica]KAF7292748.1 hypothetical protein MIND_01173300 [Mycena indigotica]